MKKTIKILIIALLLILAFGTRASNAVTSIGESSSVSTIIAGLNSGDRLIRITRTVRRQNANIFCRAYSVPLSQSLYRIDNGAPAIQNESAEAYVFNSNKSKTIKQQAYWYLVNGIGSYRNALAIEAEAYESFINSYNNTTLTITNTGATKTFENNGKKTYGPIKISYAYSSNSGFGGLCYAFLDKNGNQINSGITLSTQRNSENNINTQGKKTVDGIEYSVVNGNYSGQNLYINVTESVLYAKLVVRTWKKSIIVNTIQITGTKEQTGVTYCAACVDTMSNAVTINPNTITMNEDNPPLFIDTNAVIGPKEAIYKYKNTTEEYGEANSSNYFYFKGTISGRYVNEKLNDNNTPSAASGGNYVHKCTQCQKVYKTETEFKQHVFNVGYHYQGNAYNENIDNATGYYCWACLDLTGDSQTFLTSSELKEHYWAYHKENLAVVKVYNYVPWSAGCGVSGCGQILNAGGKEQYLTIFVSSSEVIEYSDIKSLAVEFEPAIQELELIKYDGDTSNKTKLSGAKFTATFSNVKKYTFQNITYNGSTNIPEFTLNQSIKITNVIFQDKTKPITITLTETKAANSSSSNYYYKKLEGPITISINFTNNGLTNGGVRYEGTELINNNSLIINSSHKFKAAIWVPNIRLIDIEGTVWLDGTTGIKPATEPNGTMGTNEKKVANVLVNLTGTNIQAFGTDGKPKSISPVWTGTNGKYSYTGLRWNKSYTVTFNYDGVNYTTPEGSSNDDARKKYLSTDYNNATENGRTNFNQKFNTIMPGKTATNITLEYETKNGKSTIETLTKNNAGNVKYPVVVSNYLEMGTVKTDFNMQASKTKTLTSTTKNLNLGLLKRGTNIGLGTDVSSARVTINDKEGIYTYNNGVLTIGSEETFENTQYTLNLYESDYDYRIRDYVTNTDMHYLYTNENGQRPDEDEQLRVFVTYKIELDNKSISTTYINELKYVSDIRYMFDAELTKQINSEITNMVVEQQANNTLKISFNKGGLELGEEVRKELFLVFEVDLVKYDSMQGEIFANNVEIMSYSTNEGYIDEDSQPGNCASQHEDDCDKSGGLTINVVQNNPRRITGYAFDKDNNSKVNGVIVQLIELKELGDQTYEYIWQEVVSGFNGHQKMLVSGNEIEVTDFTKGNDGEYTFEGFIPGDYFIRFIYGDGSTYTYNISDEETKKVTIYDNIHNGQDYKTMVNEHYDEEYYNPNDYTGNIVSIARDNEARRLETIANYVEIDKEKGTLLKLLDTRDLNQFNEEEVKVLANLSGKSNVNELEEEDLTKLLDELVLPSTWMCAESAKVVVGVKDNTSFDKMNIGLQKRPEYEITLRKDITSMSITASNGQEILNAIVGDDDELHGTVNNLTRVNIDGQQRAWRFEATPTDINTIIDGAKIEYTYRIVATNTGNKDYLSSILVDTFNNSDNPAEYKEYLSSCVNNIKQNLLYVYGYNTQIGTYLSTEYYKGGTSNNIVKTDIREIRDYLDNGFDLQGELSPNVSVINNVPHFILNDVRDLQPIVVNKVIKTNPTGKLNPNGESAEYRVSLYRNPLSSTGTLDFFNYVAEVMSYSNAAGRRVKSSVPGNVEAINKNIDDARSLEIDEAEVDQIRIAVATGDDKKANITWMIAIAGGLVVIAAGVFVTKKYVIK